MAKDPAFLFYPNDWLEGTAELLPEEKGVYVDLLCYQHQRGSLTTDKTRLARMVGLSVEDFEKIWDVLKDKFDHVDNRLVNRRLNQEMTKRKELGKRNKISGTFASLLRTGDFSKSEWKQLKQGFTIDAFYHVESERLTECLTEWIYERLKSIRNVNVNIDINKDTGNKGGYGGKNGTSSREFYDSEIESNQDGSLIEKYKMIADYIMNLDVVPKMEKQLSYKGFVTCYGKAKEYGYKLSDYLISMDNWKEGKSGKNVAQLRTDVSKTLQTWIRNDAERSGKIYQ